MRREGKEIENTTEVEKNTPNQMVKVLFRAKTPEKTQKTNSRQVTEKGKENNENTDHTRRSYTNDKYEEIRRALF